MKPPKYATEAALCADFLAWVRNQHANVQCFAEWAGWDILLVYPEGWQVGIQAKLRLNAEVILQAAPDRWDDGDRGPDYRAILVPEANGWSAVAARLGLVVFHPTHPDVFAHQKIRDFSPRLRDGYHDGDRNRPDRFGWIDWNPVTRHELPPCPTDAIAGSPCPVSLTGWKLGALDVLAELAVAGTITTKRIRALGIDPRRWTENCWLLPAEKRGDWIRGEKCPAFDVQHPTAFALALAKARVKVPA